MTHPLDHDPTAEPGDCLDAILNELAGSALENRALLEHGVLALTELERLWHTAEGHELERRDELADARRLAREYYSLWRDEVYRHVPDVPHAPGLPAWLTGDVDARTAAAATYCRRCGRRLHDSRHGWVDEQNRTNCVDDPAWRLHDPSTTAADTVAPAGTESRTAQMQIPEAAQEAPGEARDWAQHLWREQSVYGRTAAREFGGTHGRPVPAWLDDDYLREWDADWMRGQVTRGYRRPPSPDDDTGEPGGMA